MNFTCKFIEFIFLISISISFATDGSLLNSRPENTDYPRAKGYPQPVTTNDIQTEDRRDKPEKKEVRLSVAADRRKTGDSSVAKPEDMSFISDYEYNLPVQNDKSGDSVPFPEYNAIKTDTNSEADAKKWPSKDENVDESNDGNSKRNPTEANPSDKSDKYSQTTKDGNSKEYSETIRDAHSYTEYSQSSGRLNTPSQEFSTVTNQLRNEISRGSSRDTQSSHFTSSSIETFTLKNQTDNRHPSSVSKLISQSLKLPNETEPRTIEATIEVPKFSEAYSKRRINIHKGGFYTSSPSIKSEDHETTSRMKLFQSTMTDSETTGGPTIMTNSQVSIDDATMYPSGSTESLHNQNNATNPHLNSASRTTGPATPDSLINDSSSILLEYDQLSSENVSISTNVKDEIRDSLTPTIDHSSSQTANDSEGTETPNTTQSSNAVRDQTTYILSSSFTTDFSTDTFKTSLAPPYLSTELMMDNRDSGNSDNTDAITKQSQTGNSTQSNTELETATISNGRDSWSTEATEQNYTSDVVGISSEFNNHSTTSDAFFVKMSSERVEISDDDNVDVYWLCPPVSVTLSDEGQEYSWFKVPKEGFTEIMQPLHAELNPSSRRLALEIKKSKLSETERYFCASWKTSIFAPSEIYFYQIVVLKTKWIDIGSTETVSLYFNEKAIFNCPHGDIIKNNKPLKGAGCSSRITVHETVLTTKEDSYKCTNANRTTIKLPAVSSSENCSLSLLGCSHEENLEVFKEAADTIPLKMTNIEKCFLQSNGTHTNSLTSKRCKGKLFIRFYFNQKQTKCFPFETDLCADDFQSFSTLSECEESCLKIETAVQNCFYPLNTNIMDHCSSELVANSYMVTYDIENNICKWFYHCQGQNLTKNVFSKMSSCKEACVNKEGIIKIEAYKACGYYVQGPMINGTAQLRWSYNKETETCQMSHGRSDQLEPFITFRKKRSCEKFSQKVNRTEICKSRPENGLCIKRVLRWYFNWQERKCVQILDGGCGDSLNRFDSRLSCEQMCLPMLEEITSSQTTPMQNVTTGNSSVKYWRSQRSTTHIQQPTVRRRFNRRIPAYEMRLTTTNRAEFVTTTTASILHLNVLDRVIEFDPCFRNATVGQCDFGFDRNPYKMTRYAFKPDDGRCYKVAFSGCKGGENLYDDANDCKSACESRLYSSLKHPGCQSPFSEKCFAMNKTRDTENLKRFFFLPSHEECIEFNSVATPDCLNQYFQTAQQCKQVCSPKPPMESMLQNRCFGKIAMSDSTCSEDQKVYMWFYLSDIHQCLQYSTCPINFGGNMFSSRAECEDSCRASNILTICGLPVNQGVGKLNNRRYFYNSKLGKCQLFYYKGSLGNLNRFITKTECEKVCPSSVGDVDNLRSSSLISNMIHHQDYNGTFTNETWLHSTIDREYCYDPHKYGECSVNYPEVYMKKYYYDAYRRQCEPYIFSGCGAISRNSFDSMSVCDKMCTERITKTVSSLCSQKVSKCPDSKWIYWMYNSERGACEPFSSCMRKSEDMFFFSSEQQCSRLCVPTLPLKKDLFDICHLPPTIKENCSEKTERWFYDEPTRTCQSGFGCDHYGNNFPSLSVCLSSCEPQQLKNVCQLPGDRGPCSENSTIKYFFDWKTQSCKTLNYGGCLGNRNRFQTLLDCQSACPRKNRCNLRFHNLNCSDSNKNNVSNLYIYNTKLNLCEAVNGLLCGDYTQLFEIEEECKSTCVITVEHHSIVHRKELAETFTKNIQNLNSQCFERVQFTNYPLCLNTEEWLPRYYFDTHKDQCIFFYYNGCNGTEDYGNRFSNISQCDFRCRRNSHKANVASTSPSVKITRSISLSSHELFLKTGYCPEASNTCKNFQTNMMACNSDNDCLGIKKCCLCETNKSSISICTEPISCMATKYGCCADGISLAKEKYHHDCSRQSVKIDNSLPEIILHDSDEDLTLNCLVSGDPKPNVTWIFLGASTRVLPAETNWDLIHPLWSGVVKVTPIDPIYGLWSCHAVNENSMDEKTVMVDQFGWNASSLSIYSIENQHGTTVNVTVNNKVTLHCPIYGVPRPTITWFYNKISVNESFRSLSVSGRFLRINNALLIHGGIWTCTAKNNLGTLTYPIKLRILDPLRILPPPFGTMIKTKRGNSITLFCNVKVEGFRSVVWYWEADDTIQRINSTSPMDDRILHIPSFNNIFFGNYVCEASNAVNKDRIKFTMVPYKLDDIVVNPSGDLFVGSRVVLVCPENSSIDDSKFTWKKGHATLNIKTQTLEVRLQSTSDSGFYSCSHGENSYLTYLIVEEKLLTS